MRNLFPEAPPRPINTLEFTYGTKEIPRLDMRYDDVVEDEDLNLVVTATSVMRNFRARATKGGLGVLAFKPELILETHLLRYSHQRRLLLQSSVLLFIFFLLLFQIKKSPTRVSQSKLASRQTPFTVVCVSVPPSLSDMSCHLASPFLLLPFAFLDDD